MGTYLTLPILAAILYALGRVMGYLGACAKELIQIRSTLQSLHDRAVPELLMHKWERERIQRKGW